MVDNKTIKLIGIANQIPYIILEVVKKGTIILKIIIKIMIPEELKIPPIKAEITGIFLLGKII